MSAYEDGFNGWQHAPSDRLSDSEKTQWRYGSQDRENRDRAREGASMSKPSPAEGLDGLSSLFLVFLVFLCGGLAMLLQATEHFMAYSYPAVTLPLTMISCALVIFWLFKKYKILSIGLLIASLIFIEHWIRVLQRRGFDLSSYNLLGIVLFVLLAIGFAGWLIARMKGKKQAREERAEAAAKK
jgi:hypothetical protein